MKKIIMGSRPLLSRSGCISTKKEETTMTKTKVLVPFYRGAVVFEQEKGEMKMAEQFSSPFIEERLYLNENIKSNANIIGFSSPFIEERLYLIDFFDKILFLLFSSPFIEERLYFAAIN